MITQIEIDGFKTFKDFKVELAPFQVIVGPNGSGKSNLFDALQLLSLLTNNVTGNAKNITTSLRGGLTEALTRFPSIQLMSAIGTGYEGNSMRNLPYD